MLLSDHYPDFFTATILEWKPLLNEDKYKDIIIDSLRFMVDQQRVKVFAFVIMKNHLHLIWQAMGKYSRKDIQLSFMKFTAQMILKELRNASSPMLEELMVYAADRKYQVWERRPLSVSLWNQNVFEQKLSYIHNNPVAAGVCRYADDYKYSSAAFYYGKPNCWSFLSHYKE